jgi:DNA-binding CsgD family transcriptional regulator
MAGDEAANRVLAAIFERARTLGMVDERVLEGLSLPPSRLLDPAGRQPWDDLCVFMERIAAAAGGRLEFERLIEDTVTMHPAMVAIGALIPDAKPLYYFGNEQVARRLYYCVSVRTDTLPDGRLDIRERLTGGHRGCMEFFVAANATFRAYPRLIGHPDASVEADLGPREARHLITLARPHNLATRALDALGSLAERLRREVQARDLEALVGMAYDTGPVNAKAFTVAERLAGADGLEAVADELFAACNDLFLSRRVTLWAQADDGTLALVKQRGDGPIGVLRSRTLRVLDREVGRVEIETSDAVERSPTPLFDAVLRATANAVARCIDLRRSRAGTAVPAGAMGDLAAVCRDFARRKGLTERQAEVVGALAHGRTNREIAHLLHVTEKTVEFHIGRIFDRCGVETRTGLVAELMRHL